MAYTKTNWVNEGPPAISADNLNNIENGIYNHDVFINGIVDHIIEQGQSGNWFYRKWDSGVLEQYYSGALSSYAVNTARGSLYSGADVVFTYPVTFYANPVIVGSCSLATAAYVLWFQFNAYGTGSCQGRIASSGSVAATNGITVFIRAIGRWKA